MYFFFFYAGLTNIVNKANTQTESIATVGHYLEFIHHLCGLVFLKKPRVSTPCDQLSQGSTCHRVTPRLPSFLRPCGPCHHRWASVSCFQAAFGPLRCLSPDFLSFFPARSAVETWSFVHGVSVWIRAAGQTDGATPQPGQKISL